MSEQWFLDLDGVRSGPYQTSEVMSLVAEGEILPHHLIALELKSQKWMTILEWRLNQNKTAAPVKEVPPVSSYSPAKESGPIIPPVENIPIAPVVTVPITPQKATMPPPVDPTKPVQKRDPLADMFDMLQNTKQKREVKSQQSHAQAHANASHAHPTPAPHAATHVQPNAHVVHTPSTPTTAPSKNNWGKTILIAIGITIAGFALGQFFQHQKPSETTTVVAPAKGIETIANTPTVTPIDEKGNTKEPEKMGTMDRSTDKMTIRAKVPVNTGPAPTPEHVKDAQELKDLKKELLELKALKDEIRNSNGNDDAGRMANPNSPPQDNEPEGTTPPHDQVLPENEGENAVHY